jgi:hypothetical protein
VAVGSDGDFDEDVGGLEVGWDVDFVYLVGFVEFDDLDGLHFLGDGFDAHLCGSLVEFDFGAVIEERKVCGIYEY